MPFSDLGLSRRFVSAVATAGYKTPTPIQQQAIPHVLARRDVLGIAQTGTGKTAAFTLPMLTMLEGGRARARMPRTLILEPTRELADWQRGKFCRIRRQPQAQRCAPDRRPFVRRPGRRLARVGVDVLIATPGPIAQSFRTRTPTAQRRRTPGDRRSRCRCSTWASFPTSSAFANLSRSRGRRCSSPRPCRRKFAASPSSSCTIQFASRSPDRRRLSRPQPSSSPNLAASRIEKRDTLRRLIRSAEGMKNAIIFCNRKRDVATLFRSLLRHGFSVQALHGDIGPAGAHGRARTISQRRGDITRGVGCRGARARYSGRQSHLSFRCAEFHPDDYVHRIGRTGRAGRSGTAITMVAGTNDGKAVAAMRS